ncbi:rhodanese-like domain-containing protein [Allorhodopirellula solitaria]|uniref:Inner membrane protein YgaP n=1 Tax=Allorhodopirellula solitaria TaxID=2527987 RepID=A0A5C5YBD5_9BACT|nr:rhodanese-like domain-containing protein [Allorhodopirellula solitaria]TWT73016.1 Inner membrane protein YgaP [Allorhodopirellula solitaria]
MTASPIISVDELAHRTRQGSVDLIDVRTPMEFRGVHAAPARNMPLDGLDPQAAIAARTAAAEEPVYVICKAGSRGAKAQQKFIDAGFTDVINIDGGTDAWVAAGLPVVRGKQTMSLERQVRIAAGSIVLVGALLALLVHPAFAGVCAFVGAGLMFAGITDTCAMGMLIARMPWNQSTDGSCST